MSDTPRTDFFVRCKGANSQDMMSVSDFARQLEREIAALKAALETSERHWVEDDRNLNELIAENERLRGLMRELGDCLRGHMIGYNCHGPVLTPDQVSRLAAALEEGKA